jgi:hypothetical protein
MSKHYTCDHCDNEVHWSRKVSITTNGDNASFNIIQGNSTHYKEFIHRKNFYRLDYCNVNCMIKSLTSSKYEAVKVKEL